MQFKHKELSEKIFEAAFEVSNELGAGFLESVYKIALRIALQQKGLKVAIECPLHVIFRRENNRQIFC